MGYVARFSACILKFFFKRRAASFGKKVAVVEATPYLGGTCVNVGTSTYVIHTHGSQLSCLCASRMSRVCAEESEFTNRPLIPTDTILVIHFASLDCIVQIMWHAADLQDKMTHHAPGYKFDGVDKPHFNWASFKPQRDAYIRRLNNIYANNFEKEGVEFHQGTGHLTSPNTVEVRRSDGHTYTLKADHITVAVGGEPIIPSDDQIPGASLGINSDGFFDLTKQPKRVAVIGAGYIAVELAGIFHTLGSEVHMFIRGETVLRTFDPSLQEVLTPWMEKTGISIHKKANVTRIEGERGETLTVHTDTDDKVDIDVVLWAIGRRATTHGLGLEELGVELDKKGDIIVDEYQNTSVKGIYAIGDVQGKWLLTPVAIAAGRRLANRLFGPPVLKDDRLSYDNIPSVVFSYVLMISATALAHFVVYLPRHPPLGTVGLTEPQAREKYGDAVKICM